MELKEYQVKTLDRVKEYLALLLEWRKRAEENADLEIDFAERAWTKVGNLKPYQQKKDGLGNPLPNFCLKIPTGGGKTLLATKTIDLINQHYLQKQFGLVLWIVPTTQIYNQTIKNLKDKGHPYRQALDMASGGKTMVIEKMDHFTPQDLEENLVILMMMLPAANRQNKETLKVFQDNGFAEFFPPEDDIEGQNKILNLISNLDCFGEKEGFWGRQIKTSLGNVLRMCQPVIILDEGHKAYSEGAQATLRGFNPSIIVELSATPDEGSNVLIEIFGLDLLREEMIKLDLHITNKASADWKDTLMTAVNQRKLLEEKAIEYDANTGNYIRPICVLQAERTGKDQRESRFIHSEDIKSYLISVMGIAPEEIAIKTSEKDELKEVDDVGGLMSRNCPIRYIITKQALQEGWDCPFAYVLAILTNPSSQNALTQLVGRILRQPYAKKIKSLPELDESYVYCFQQGATDLLAKIKKGFEAEGLGDLYSHVKTGGEFGDEIVEERIYKVRDKFQKVAGEIILPIFLINRDSKWHKVDYQVDLVSKIDWNEIVFDPLYNLVLSNTEEKDTEQITTLVEDRQKLIEQKEVRKLREGALEADPVFLARNLADVVPNPWITFEMGTSILAKLREKYDERKIVNNFVFIVEEIKKHIVLEKDRLAKEIFIESIEKEILRFYVIGKEFGYRLPKEIKAKATDPVLTRSFGDQLQLSLFDHVPANGLNETERAVALYLDDQEKLFFWYRNQSKKDFSIQGWRRQKVYADFIFTTKKDEKNVDKIYIVETKGQHLIGNADSEYKESLFDLCNQLAKERTVNDLGLEMKNKEMRFEFIGEDEWKQKLNQILA